MLGELLNMSIVHDACNIYLRNKKDSQDLEYAARKRGPWKKGNLWSSDTGNCHRKAILRVTGTSGSDFFNDKSLGYMNTGVITEDETALALKYVYGDRLETQVELKYNMWSGKVDFGIDVGRENPILIEHKTTSEKAFDTDSKTELPKHPHIGQTISYYWMYERIYGVKPKMLIFYKAWGNFAEFELIPDGDNIQILSNVNGVLDAVVYKYNVEAEINELMQWYDSTELPPRLDKQYKGCTFLGKPSCQFYNTCWGE